MGVVGAETLSQEEIRQSVEAGLLTLGQEFTDQERQQMARYLFLLNRWNRVHSLTAIDDLESQVRRHLLDALAVAPEVSDRIGQIGQNFQQDGQHGPRIADIGSGMGVPGMVWAIVMPQFSFDLIERQSKKAAFLRQVSASLGLSNRVRVVEQDVTKIRGEPGYDLITSRAFAALPDFIEMTYGISAPNTLWAALVGQLKENISEQTHTIMNNKIDNIEITKISDVSVPGLNETRHLVWLRRRF
jgi:16S rRNA (guanine527-N7)-methyltransferase